MPPDCSQAGCCTCKPAEGAPCQNCVHSRVVQCLHGHAYALACTRRRLMIALQVRCLKWCAHANELHCRPAPCGCFLHDLSSTRQAAGILNGLAIPEAKRNGEPLQMKFMTSGIWHVPNFNLNLHCQVRGYISSSLAGQKVFVHSGCTSTSHCVFTH